MRARVVYVHHDCFVLRLGDGRALLFDYPAAEHRPEGAEGLVAEAVRGTDLTVFFSHSHGDHCGPDVDRAVRTAARVGHVVSYDVPEMVPELDRPGALVVEPEEPPAELGDLRVAGLEATDLGVAFLVELGPCRVYFGGDLAEWVWPGVTDAARRFEEERFAEAVEQVARFAPALAFSAVDPRLPAQGGGLRLAARVRPRLFVPMHAFGRTRWLRRHVEGEGLASERYFLYDEPGDSVEVELRAEGAG